jgi:hypothetical protein
MLSWETSDTVIVGKIYIYKEINIASAIYRYWAQMVKAPPKTMCTVALWLGKEATNCYTYFLLAPLSTAANAWARAFTDIILLSRHAISKGHWQYLRPMISFIEDKLQDIAVRVKQHTQWEELLGKKFLTTKALFGIRQLKKHTQFLETRSPPNGSVSCPISKKNQMPSF